MYRKKTLKTLPVVLAAAPLLGLSGHAVGAGFQLFEQTASGLGNAYAGSAAVAENAATIFYNPAGMTQLAGTQVSAGTVYIDLNTHFNNGASRNPGNPVPLGGGAIPTGFFNKNLGNTGASGGDAAFVPNFYLSTPLTKDLYVGVGLGATFGMRTAWGNTWTGRYMADTTDVKAINLNPSLAWRVNDTVSLGFGVDYQRFNALITSTLNGGAAGDGIFHVSGSDDNSWGYNLGALFKLSPDTKVGVSYRSSVKHTLVGQYHIGIAPTVAAGVYGFKATSGTARVNVELPDTFILSGTHQLNERWELLADVSRTGWSKLPELRIQFDNGSTDKVNTYNWRNTWRAAVGANYRYSDDLKLKFGVAFDQGVVSDAYRTPRLPDSDRYWLSLGAQYKVSKQGTLDVGYSYVKGKTASSNLGAGDTSSILTGVLNGEYKSSVQIVGVQYSHAF